MNKSDEKVLNEQVLEIRFRPEAKVLDHRGDWAIQLSHHLNLSEWRISENKLDVYQKDETKRAFISFKNSGCTLRNQNESSFEDFTREFLRFFTGLSVFRTPKIERIGVLGRFAINYSGTFEDLLQLYTKKIYSVQPAFVKALKGDIIDIGGDVNFKTDDRFINTRTGPMEKKQLKEYFQFEDNPPDVATYFHIDSFFTPEISPSMNNKQILKLVQDYISGNWSRLDEFSNLLLNK